MNIKYVGVEYNEDFLYLSPIQIDKHGCEICSRDNIYDVLYSLIES